MKTYFSTLNRIEYRQNITLIKKFSKPGVLREVHSLIVNDEILLQVLSLFQSLNHCAAFPNYTHTQMTCNCEKGPK